MKIRHIAVRSAATVLLVALGVAGVGAAPVNGVSDTEIVLGTHIDLSGPVAASMPPIRDAMEMRLDEANEAGGINGRKIRLVVEDNGSQPQMAVRAVQKLISSDHVFAIINAFGSGTNAAVVKRATDAGVIYWSPWAAAKPLHTIAGDTPLLYTTTENYDVTTATGLAWMLDKFKAKRVGIIYQEGPFGDLARAGTEAVLLARNMKPVAEASYTVGDIDFSSQVARMRAANADIIVVAALIRETVGVMSEVKKLGWTNVKMLAAQPSTNEDTTNLGKDTVNDLYGIATFNVYYPSDAPAAVKAWMASFRKRYNVEPTDTAYLAYGFTDWFVKNGLSAAGRDLTSDKVVKALATTSYSSPLFYDAKHFTDGYLTPETVQVEQIQNGTWRKISAVIQPVAVK